MTTHVAENDQPLLFRGSGNSFWGLFTIYGFLLAFGVGMIVADLPTVGKSTLYGLVMIGYVTYGCRHIFALREPVRLYSDRITFRAMPWRTSIVPLDGATLHVGRHANGVIVCAVGTDDGWIRFEGSNPGMAPLYERLSQLLPVEEHDPSAPPRFDQVQGIYRRNGHDRAVWTLIALVCGAASVLTMPVYFISDYFPSPVVGMFMSGGLAIACAASLYVVRLQSTRYIVEEDAIVEKRWPRKPRTFPLEPGTTMRWRRALIGPVLVLRNRHGQLHLHSRLEKSNHLENFDQLARALEARVAELQRATGATDPSPIQLPIFLGPRWYMRLSLDFIALLFWLAAGYCVWAVLAWSIDPKIGIAGLLFGFVAAFLTFGIVRRIRIDEGGIRVVYRFWSRRIARESICAVGVHTQRSMLVSESKLIVEIPNRRAITLDATALHRPAHEVAGILRQIYGL